MSIIQKISTCKNYNRAMNAVKKAEIFVLKNDGLNELLASCDTVHITMPQEKGFLPSIKRFFASVKNTMPSFTFYEEAFISKFPHNSTVEYRYKQHRTLVPNRTFKVVLDQKTNKIAYSKETSCGIDRFVRFDNDGKVLQIYYEGFNAPNKSVFYGNGKREVTKYSI